jgi:coenzyme F420-reducing hydrogenase alpha subunit
MTKVNLDVDVHHIARVEGHGNIHVRVKEGMLQEARWDVVETPRYFEVMLKGKHYTSASLLTSRICGICSIAHSLTSLEATEAALGVDPPPLARKLRLLAKHGETLQSHYLHLFFLAAPDFLGLQSAIPLLDTNPEVVDIARRLKGLANDLCDVVAGRTTHPIAFKVGGVTTRPKPQKLLALRDRLARSVDDVAATADLIASFDLPDFVRETEFVSLRGTGDDGYPFIGRQMISTDGVEKGRDDYLAMTNEFVDGNNTSKWCKLSRDAFAVGALARFNVNADRIHPEARKVADRFGLAPVCHNPFMNNVAQLVECVHCTHESIRLIDELADDEGELSVDVTPRAGAGVGAVEAPRGILYHRYEYNAEGFIERADCVIPTTQNNLNIHLDLKALVQQLAGEAGMTDARLELLCCMLVRAYDPCISCSVH